MKLDHAAIALQAAATALLGLMAGFFFAFAVDVAPALRELDGPAYTAAQQAINRVVRNAVFGGVYFGSVLLPLAAAVAWYCAGERASGHAWLALSLAYIGAVFVLTSEVNVPINNAMALWDPAAPPAGWQHQRDRWNDANLVRSIASALCFGAALLVPLLRARSARPS